MDLRLIWMRIGAVASGASGGWLNPKNLHFPSCSGPIKIALPAAGDQITAIFFRGGRGAIFSILPQVAAPGVL